MNASARFALRLFFRGLVLAVATGAVAQSGGTDYTASLPSVQKVESQLKGTDPADTIARQVAVFNYLQIYIQRIKETRDYRGPYSPSEQAARVAYAQASYQLSQDFTKTHTPAEVQKWQFTEGNYEINNALDWIKQLEGQQAADTYAGAESSLAQTYQQHEQQMQQQMKQDNGQGPGQGLDAFLGGGGGGGNLDDKQKRCLELGGTYDQCASSLMGLVNVIGSMVTLGAADNSEPPPPLSGVLLVGKYHSRTDMPEVTLNASGAAILGSCGTLVDGTRGYTIHKSGGATEIVLDNEPDPIVLAVRADGSLAGPGNIAVKGSIITGYNNQYSCTAGSVYVHSTCSSSSIPIYAPSMQRCTVSQMAPQAPPPPAAKPGGLIGQVGDMLGQPDPVAPIYGFRMIGPYVSNGMQLSFDNHSVTVDCGKAHVNVPYTVENAANGFAVHVQNAGGAFLLAVAADGTLRGSGSTTVNGRLFSGVNGKVVSFTPHSESCAVGTFEPKGQKDMMVVMNGPMPSATASVREPARGAAVMEPVDGSSAASSGAAPAASALEASLAGAGISSTPNGGRAQLRIVLSTSFAGSNPLAGQAVFVSRKPMDQILRELGVAVPAKATPAQAMKALQTQCQSAGGCSAVIQGMPKYYVTTTKLDPDGKATLSATAATGQYYFFAIVPGDGGSRMWDVPAALNAGDNAVTFTAENSEVVR